MKRSQDKSGGIDEQPNKKARISIEEQNWLLKFKEELKVNNEILHLAALEGDIDTISAILKAGNIDVNSSSIIKGITPLYVASGLGKVESINALLDQGANIEAQNPDGFTPLHVASWCGKVEVIKILIDQGSNIEAQNTNGYTPLHIASEKGKVESINALLDQGANIEAQNILWNTPLHSASWCGNVEVIKILIDQGAKIEAQNTNGNTPLHVASWCGYVEVVKILLEAGANIEAQNTNGNTPLNIASEKGEVEVIKILIDQGANIEAKDINLTTPLHVASWCGKVEVIKILIDQGANIEAKDISLSTPLRIAYENGKVESMKVLLSAGAIARNEMLENAVINSQYEICKLLLQFGSGLQLVNQQAINDSHQNSIIQNMFFDARLVDQILAGNTGGINIFTGNKDIVVERYKYLARKNFIFGSFQGMKNYVTSLPAESLPDEIKEEIISFIEESRASVSCLAFEIVANKKSFDLFDKGDVKLMPLLNHIEMLNDIGCTKEVVGGFMKIVELYIELLKAKGVELVNKGLNLDIINLKKIVNKFMNDEIKPEDFLNQLKSTELAGAIDALEEEVIEGYILDFLMFNDNRPEAVKHIQAVLDRGISKKLGEFIKQKLEYFEGTNESRVQNDFDLFAEIKNLAQSLDQSQEVQKTIAEQNAHYKEVIKSQNVVINQYEAKLKSTNAKIEQLKSDKTEQDNKILELQDIVNQLIGKVTSLEQSHAIHSIDGQDCEVNLSGTIAGSGVLAGAEQAGDVLDY